MPTQIDSPEFETTEESAAGSRERNASGAGTIAGAAAARDSSRDGRNTQTDLSISRRKKSAYAEQTHMKTPEGSEPQDLKTRFEELVCPILDLFRVACHLDGSQGAGPLRNLFPNGQLASGDQRGRLRRGLPSIPDGRFSLG